MKLCIKSASHRLIVEKGMYFFKFIVDSISYLSQRQETDTETKVLIEKKYKLRHRLKLAKL